MTRKDAIKFGAASAVAMALPGMHAAEVKQGHNAPSFASVK